MPPKPIDKRRPDECRAAIWATIRALHKAGTSWSVRDLYVVNTLGVDTIRDYVVGLHAAGYVEAVGTVYIATSRKNATLYRLLRDTGLEAPRVRKDGTEVTQGRGRENMWRTMPILQEFTGRDLAIAASTEEHPVAESEAETYCQVLARAKYLIVVEKGRPNHPTRYRQLPAKHTGPKPPQVQRVKQLYDPNLKKVVWEGVPCDCK